MEEIEIILIVIIVVLVLIALIVMMIKCIEASRKGEEVSNVSLLSFYLVPNQPQTCLHSIYDYGVWMRRNMYDHCLTGNGMWHMPFDNNAWRLLE